MSVPDSTTEASLISALQLAMKSATPDDFEDKNYAFVYSLMHANKYLPQAVLGLHTMKALVSLHESDSKMGRIYSRIASSYEYAMCACSSIDGRLLNDLLVKKVMMKQQQIEVPQKGGGGLGSLFGGGGGTKPPQGGGF